MLLQPPSQPLANRILVKKKKGVGEYEVSLCKASLVFEFWLYNLQEAGPPGSWG